MEQKTDHGTEKTTVTHTECLPVGASKIDVGLRLAHRQKGLLWYSTYAVNFAGDYTFFKILPATIATSRFSGFRSSQPSRHRQRLTMSIDGLSLDATSLSNGVTGHAHLASGQSVGLTTGYRSRGLDSWKYHFGDGGSQVRNFTLAMHTNFKAIDFPESTISPTSKTENLSGWDLTWNCTNLVAGYDISMAMPENCNPDRSPEADQATSRRFLCSSFSSSCSSSPRCAASACTPP